MSLKQSRKVRQYAIAVIFSSLIAILLSFRYKLEYYDYATQANKKIFGEDNAVRQISYDSSQLNYTYKSLWEASNDLKNFWLYFRSIINRTSLLNETKNVDDGYTAINGEITRLVKLSTAHRKQQLENLSNIIRNKIKRLQNPDNCDEARLLITEISTSGCGFGCTFHSVINSLLRAFMGNRTLILLSKGWVYSPEGWEWAFLPPSVCTYSGNLSNVKEGSTYKGARVLKSNSRKGKIKPWISWSVPRELAPTLKNLHGHPYAWWVSQFTNYLFQLQPWLEKKFRRLGEINGFSNSVVGIQVRWGDKIDNEAIKHELDEYMLFVEQWYKRMENSGNSINKTIYVASEQVEVWTQLKQKHPEYTVISSQPENSVVGFRQRYRHDGLQSVIADIYFLSRCSYLVCTLSSSVCRTAYELMMNRHADASVRFQSVDTLYRVKYAVEQPWIAIMDHEPSKARELGFRKGDEIMVNLDPHIPMNDGFMRGRNSRTRKNGEFPAFKVREEVKAYDMPAF